MTELCFLRFNQPVCQRGAKFEVITFLLWVRKQVEIIQKVHFCFIYSMFHTPSVVVHVSCLGVLCSLVEVLYSLSLRSWRNYLREV